MTLRVEQGKGRKDRYAMLPPLLLERLRTWWRVARAPGGHPNSSTRGHPKLLHLIAHNGA
jgi:integrase